MTGRKKLLGAAAGMAALIALASPAAASAASAGPSSGPGVAPITNVAAIRALRTEIRSGAASKSLGLTGCRTMHLLCDYVALTPSKNSARLLTSSTPVGYGATDLEQAYGVTVAPSTTGTIAILDAGTLV
jgi:hypothetical protein